MENSSSPVDRKYLLPTDIIDCDHRSIVEFADQVLKNVAKDPVSMAVRLYYVVRDDIWYDPYYPFYLPEHYRASNVLKSQRGFCISKASLLCALARACDIPCRVGFATVRNHLATQKLLDYLGSDVFVYHGFTEFYLQDEWVKATPTFNAELCEKHQVAPLEFDGQNDSIFQAYNMGKKMFMEYINYHGVYADIPVNAIVAAWKKAYGKNRVEKWIQDLQKAEKQPEK